MSQHTAASPFSAGDEVFVERRPWRNKQSIHQGRILETYPDYAVVKLVGVPGKVREKIPYEKLRRMPLAAPEPPQLVKIERPVKAELRAVPVAFAKLELPMLESSATASLDLEDEDDSRASTASPSSVNLTKFTPSVTSAPTATPNLHPDIATWLEMGMNFGDALDKRIKALRKEAAHLAEEAQRLMDEADSKHEEAVKLESEQRGLDAISDLVRNAAQAATTH